MAEYVRIFMVMMLAAFAVGTAVNAAIMSAPMTLAVIDGADMGDCLDCPDGSGDVLSCDNVCVSPILAVVPSGQPSLPEIEATTKSLVLQGMPGRIGPPDPLPPKSTILS